MKIPLSNNCWLLLDETDFWLFQAKKRSVSAKGYLTYTRWDGEGKVVATEYFHKTLLSPPEEGVVDHINGDKLDNRRLNLRLCTFKQNTQNRKHHKNSSSKYKGVFWHTQSSRWRAAIRVNYQRHHLGNFRDEAEAAKAYDEAAVKHFGEFARCNFR